MKRVDLPKNVNICGINYSIKYCDNAAEVDIFKRKTLWGQIDYWTRTIRIYDNGRPIEDIYQTLIHEILHGIEKAINIKCFIQEDEKESDELESLAVALTDTLIRNGWLTWKTNC